MLGRAGRLERALECIKSSPFVGDPVLWRALLSACKIHKNIEIGEISLGHLIEMSAYNAGDCSLLSGIYASKGNISGISRMRKMVKEQGLKTTPGWSCLELNGEITKFVVDDTSHPDIEQIHKKLKEIINIASLLGYAPEAFCLKSILKDGYLNEMTDEWIKNGVLAIGSMATGNLNFLLGCNLSDAA
ncbi:hypothetical protein HPP92_016503 [Vanilla planifolia]|uniref:Pentatricopeptide repeat-containing protein n=1 Tax=Vanilla planifolia TaxID=51239 RepID=A0A835QQE3_VANPL|nr:hypothetical protein HPP92_016503 [Vanilla planifolia]